MIQTTREQRRQLERDNAKLPLILFEIPSNEFPVRLPLGIKRVWRSRYFLVQLYAPEKEGYPHRLSISWTTINQDTGRWEDMIGWDDIQRLKREAGFGHMDAIEIYPNDKDVVNVANMRHIWLMDQPLEFAWRKK